MTVNPNRLFFPNKAIRHDNHRFFAGRQELLREAVRQVGWSGFSAVVYGDRGVGKTSFGWQLLELLSGNSSLVDEWNSRREVQGQDPISLALPQNCKCVWLQCGDFMQNLEGVLISLIKESKADNTLSSLFKPIYQEQQVKNKFETKFGFNLEVISAQIAFGQERVSNSTESCNTISYQERKALVHDLFIEVIEEIKYRYHDDELIFFLDEFDLLPDKSGMGKLIKSTNEARFVIIGVADNVEDIVRDHQSAGRKIGGSEFRIPRFESEEIDSIFDRAEQVHPEAIRFNEEFRQEVINKSYGYPYLVQAFGFFATQLAIDESSGGNSQIVVDVAHLPFAVKKFLGSRAKLEQYMPLNKVLQGDSQSKSEILRIISNQPDRVEISQIKDEIRSQLKRFVNQNVDVLVEQGILSKSGDTVRFRDPEARILVQLHFENAMA